MEVTPGCLSIQVPNKNIIILLQRKVKLEALSNFYKYTIWHEKESRHTNRWDITNDKAKKLTTETTLQRALEHENTDFKIPQRSSHDIKETIENSWRELNYF